MEDEELNKNQTIMLSKDCQVNISKFKGQYYVDIRKYYEKDGEWLPTQKGISLSLQQFKLLQDSFGVIDSMMMHEGNLTE